MGQEEIQLFLSANDIIIYLETPRKINDKTNSNNKNIQQGSRL